MGNYEKYKAVLNSFCTYKLDLKLFDLGNVHIELNFFLPYISVIACTGYLNDVIYISCGIVYLSRHSQAQCCHIILQLNNVAKWYLLEYHYGRTRNNEFDLSLNNELFVAGQKNQLHKVGEIKDYCNYRFHM